MTSRKSTSSSPHTADLSFEYDSPGDAERVAAALAPEVDDIDGDRTRATVSRTDRTLTLSITAADLVALRAGLNTWTALVDVAETAGEATSA